MLCSLYYNMPVTRFNHILLNEMAYLAIIYIFVQLAISSITLIHENVNWCTMGVFQDDNWKLESPIKMLCSFLIISDYFAYEFKAIRANRRWSVYHSSPRRLSPPLQRRWSRLSTGPGRSQKHSISISISSSYLYLLNQKKWQVRSAHNCLTEKRLI